MESFWESGTIIMPLEAPQTILYVVGFQNHSFKSFRNPLFFVHMSTAVAE